MWSVVLSALAANVCAQEAPVRTHNGYPQDWSDRQIVFTRDTLALHPDLLYREPRVLNQAIERWQVPDWGNFHPDNPPPVPPKKGIHRDWSFPGLGNNLRKNMFPAKFSFDPAAPPDCVNDYVVFGLAVAGSATQANLVAFNNLYVNSTGTGLCTGTAPNVMFAYNVTTGASGGQVQTSPVISLDGKKIAFVESVPIGNPGPTIFHVLTWTAGLGSIGAPAVPTSAAMSSVPVSLTASDFASSPWIDYSADSAYMGTDDGNVYQVTGVFHGIPTLSGSPWPVHTAPFRLTAPVLDSQLGLLMVGNLDGDLYQINTMTGSLGTLPIGAGNNHAILAPPIVDVTNGTTFVVDADDGAGAVLVEVKTSTLLKISTGRIGQGNSVAGNNVMLFQPAFSNDYYNGLPDGIVALCGTGLSDTTPWAYAFGFVGSLMHEPAATTQQLSTVAANGCTGWTEFFNPNVGTSPGTDFFFFGLTGNCTTIGGSSTDGCVVSISQHAGVTTDSTAEVNLGPSGIVVDNYSTAAQASSIYFTSVGVNTAYKFTQSGLQ
jgi:hypothetical protein